MDILIIISSQLENVWQETVARLNASGHTVHVRTAECPEMGPLSLKVVLAIENRLRRMAPAKPAHLPPTDFTPDLIIDFTGQPRLTVPLLTIEVNGHRNLLDGLASVKTKARRAEIVARLDGRAVALAHPMISQQTLFSHNRDELFAGIQALLVHVVTRVAAARVRVIDEPVVSFQQNCFVCNYLVGIMLGIGRRLRRLLRPSIRQFYWKTGWRLVDGPGVSESGRLAGAPFSVLPDDGTRFYADPFPFEKDGSHYIFVEDFKYSHGRGVISVARLEADGSFSTPRQVLQEQHHLSYPNVFQHEGKIYMLPEAGGTLELILYRAESFPEAWVRHATLVAGRSINDPTIFERDERLWMFATETFGAGSSSDTMVVYSAKNLTGPWLPHRLNPIVIDRAAARPGGKVIEKDGRFFLPVQDGSRVYGGGLGLREIVQLDDEEVTLGPVTAVAQGAAWPGQSIHTLNRIGRLEVVDSAS